MINHNKVTRFLSVFSLCFLPILSHATIHEYETTHLKTLGGAGAGSILLEESAFLNPASIVFYNASSIYYQNDGKTTSDNINTSYSKKSSTGVVLAQADASLSGTFSYINQKEDNYNRKRFGLSLAAATSNVSALGVSVRKSEDINTSTAKSTKYYQTVVGVTHALGEATSIGVVAYDPFKSIAHETKVILGIQQGLLNYISGILDIGADYTSKDISKKTFIRGGLQVRLLDDFYMRAGVFNDKIRNEKGEGFGLAWIQPKLAFEFGIKNTRSTSSTIDLANKETSFSVSIRGF